MSTNTLERLLQYLSNGFYLAWLPLCVSSKTYFENEIAGWGFFAFTTILRSLDSYQQLGKSGASYPLTVNVVATLNSAGAMYSYYSSALEFAHPMFLLGACIGLADSCIKTYQHYSHKPQTEQELDEEQGRRKERSDSSNIRAIDRPYMTTYYNINLGVQALSVGGTYLFAYQPKLIWVSVAALSVVAASSILVNTWLYTRSTAKVRQFIETNSERVFSAPAKLLSRRVEMSPKSSQQATDEKAPLRRTKSLGQNYSTQHMTLPAAM